MKAVSYQEFLLIRRTEDTKRSTAWSMKYCVQDPDAFLELVRRDKKKAESQLIQWIVKER